MGTLCRALLGVSFLWSLSVLGQQPTPILPNPKLTPGEVFEVTLQDICTPEYSRKVRAVPTHLKKQAYARYGITSWEPVTTRSIT